MYAVPQVENLPHDVFCFSHYHPGGVHPRFDHERPGRRRASAVPGPVLFDGREGL